MLNKVAAFLTLLLTVFIAAPATAASDIPVLTWEKGLEHNLVLGGNGSLDKWNIALVSTDGVNLPFKVSKKDARGFVYFSLDVPLELKSGVYTVVSTGGSYPNKILAGIRLVELTNYNLVQIPTKLLIILLTLIVLISTLSLLRMQKYERIEYIRAKPRTTDNPLVVPFYKFRVNSIEEINKSLFKFKLIREGELVLKLSPTLWSLLPWATLLIGGLIGTQGSMIDGVKITPALIYGAMALVGVLDPYSGFMAGIGFSIAEILNGNITSIRAIMSLVAISIGWFAPGIISSLYTDALRKDRYHSILKRFLPELIGSAVGAMVFLVAQLLTNSFADHKGPIPINSYLIPFAIGMFTFARIKGEAFLNKDLHQAGENYQIRVLQLPRVLSPRSVIFIGTYFTAAIYVWTESLRFAGMTGILLTFPLMMLMVRFESPVIPFFARFERHIALETFVVVALSYTAFVNIKDFPLDVTQKGKLFILTSVVILFIHGFYSSVYDTSHRTKELVGVQ